jgi:beta-galactosidase
MDTISLYVFWNQHEAAPGRFDWTGQNDTAAFCRLAQAEGMKVIVRPGPYVCGEWDFGGLPWWLLKDREMRIRSRYPGFMEPVRRYFRELGKQLAPLQATRGGPIIMVQVENEYDGYGPDGGYIEALCGSLRESGFDVPFFTSDMTWSLRPSKVPGLIRAVGFAEDPNFNFNSLRRVYPEGPLFCGELYTGWYDVWGRSSATGSGLKRLTNTLERVLGLGASFNLYMAHGGTSFGFTAGANDRPFRPNPTSYDYGAPMDEAGRPTAKYFAIREIMARHLAPGETLPPIPPTNRVVSLPPIRFRHVSPLLGNLPAATRAQRPETMEHLGQGQGCVLYRTKLNPGPAAELVVTEPHDFVVVMWKGRRVGTLDRRLGQRSLWLPVRDTEGTLDLLVEAMGHVNFGPEMEKDRKGITERVEIRDPEGRRELLDWEMFPLPLTVESLATLKFSRGQADGPTFHRAEFDMREVGDTFLDLRQWSKGVVWVNGHNLGRFWNIGPQQTLYLPGPWLKRRGNEIVVLDLLGPEKAEIAGLTDPILNELNLAATGRQHRRSGQQLTLDAVVPTTNGIFSPGTQWQSVRFKPVAARYVCLEALSSQATDAYTSCAELNLLDGVGREIPRGGWKILYADSEELLAEDGSGDNVLDGRPESFWHTRWDGAKEPLPHHLVIDLGEERVLGGFTYLPRQDQPNGRVGEFRFYARPDPFPGL